MESEMKAAEGWEDESLGRVAQLTMGQSPDSRYYSEEENGLPFLQGCAEFEARFPKHKMYCSQTKKLAHAGSILFSVRAPVGKINIADRDYIIGRGLAAISGIDIDQFYLEHYLIYNEPNFRNATQGSTFEAINSTELNGWPINYPTSKPEQTKIAEILSTVDRAIEQTEALIAKQQRIKTGLMQDLLTRGIDEHGNLRSEQTHQFKDSQLGRIPVEWEVVQLGNVSEISSGVTLGKIYSGLNTIELPYLRVANVQDGYLDLAEIKVIRVPKSNVEKYQLKAGDVLMNEGGDFDKLGRGTVWNDEIQNCLHQNHIFKVRPKGGELSSDYLAAVSASPYGKTFFVLASKQSTNLASINSTQLKSFPVPLPLYDEQQRIERIIRQNLAMYNETIRQLRKIQSLKKALMQDLLTGKKRVTPLVDKEEGTA